MIFKLFGIKREAPAAEALPYRMRDDFLSAAEFSFYRVLGQVVEDRAVVCPKVGVDDLLFVTGQEGRMTYVNKINRKHVDFVLCDPVSMKPMAAFELDDGSHSRADREVRDAYLDQVFAAAGLPYLHVKAKRGYTVNDIAALVEPVLRGVSAARPASMAPVPVSEGAPPTCPRCGVAMVRRTASRGANVGQKFWGCQNYPKCGEVVRVGE